MPYKDELVRRAAHREYNRKNKEVINAAERARRASDPEAFRKTRLRYRYGLSHEDYARMLNAQGGLCAICLERAATDIDHDHKTNVVRGFLCRACNLGIGNLRDNPDFLRAAIEYLTRPRG